MTVMPVWLLLLGLFSATEAGCSSSDVVKEEWNTFKITHSKNYLNQAEETWRMNVFMENKLKIARHNKKAAQGESSYTLRMNEFGDMLHTEFVDAMHGLLQQGEDNSNNTLHGSFIIPANIEGGLAPEVDWRKAGAVTKVHNQGKCGSCWAFSACGALEGQHFRKTGKLINLSEQNLVDCSGNYGNRGCNGGLPNYAFQYIKDNGGIDTEISYPYQGRNDVCRYLPKNKGATDVGYVNIPQGNEDALKYAVATIGPCSIGIDATHETFMFYDGGVYEEESCTPRSIDHAMLVIGYGTEPRPTDGYPGGKDYWLVKNSWGTGWGDGGYVKIARNMNNMCGIASMASYPRV